MTDITIILLCFTCVYLIIRVSILEIKFYTFKREVKHEIFYSSKNEKF